MLALLGCFIFISWLIFGRQQPLSTQRTSKQLKSAQKQFPETFSISAHTYCKTLATHTRV